MNWFLRPLDALLCQRANDRVLSRDHSNDVHGSIVHLFGWADGVTVGVPLCDKFAELAGPLGLTATIFKLASF